MVDSELLRKVNIVDDDDLDTMEYDDFRTYTFRPDLSKHLTGNEIITTIHPGKTVKDEKQNQFFSYIYYNAMSIFDAVIRIQ